MQCVLASFCLFEGNAAVCGPRSHALDERRKAWGGEEVGCISSIDVAAIGHTCRPVVSTRLLILLFVACGCIFCRGLFPPPRRMGRFHPCLEELNCPARDEFFSDALVFLSVPNCFNSFHLFGIFAVFLFFSLPLSSCILSLCWDLFSSIPEKKTEVLPMQGPEKPRNPIEPTPSAPKLVIESARQKYTQVSDFRSLGGLVPVKRTHSVARLKVRLVNAEAMEATLYGCTNRAPRSDHYGPLRTTHHGLLLRVIGCSRVRGTYRPLLLPKRSRRLGCNMWKRFSDNDDSSLRELWPSQETGVRNTRRGREPGQARPMQYWQDSLTDKLKAFGATDGSTENRPVTFGMGTSLWPTGAKKNGAMWYKGVVKESKKLRPPGTRWSR